MPTLPQSTGPTENALRALLIRQLAGTGIAGYDGWVALNLARPELPRTGLEARLEHETRSDPGQAVRAVDELVAAGLLDPVGAPTATGQRQLAEVRARVGAVTGQLLTGLAEDDLATAVRVLDHVRMRADSLLDG